MEAPPDKIDSDLFEELARHKTPSCLSETVLGQYLEHTLPGQEREAAEKHLESCLYCLNQLVELRELLFLEKNANPLPPHLENSLRQLAPKQNPEARIITDQPLRTFASSLTNAVSAFLKGSYAWQGATAFAIVAIIAVYIGVFPRGQKEPEIKAPSVTPTTPSAAIQPSSTPRATVEVNTPVLPKALLLALSNFRIGADVPRIASTLQKLGRNLILESTRGERDIAVFQKAAPAVVFVLAGKDSVGSGVLISRDGQVLTNWHVINGDPKPVVVLKPKDSAELKKELAFSATVIKVDEVADLALLKIVDLRVKVWVVFEAVYG